MSKEKFKQAFAEIKVTRDPYRYAYLRWISFHMWKLFDYESGYEVIKSEENYREWKKSGRQQLVDCARKLIKRRDSMKKIIKNKRADRQDKKDAVTVYLAR